MLDSRRGQSADWGSSGTGGANSVIKVARVGSHSEDCDLFEGCMLLLTEPLIDREGRLTFQLPVLSSISITEDWKRSESANVRVSSKMDVSYS